MEKYSACLDDLESCFVIISAWFSTCMNITPHVHVEEGDSFRAHTIFSSLCKPFWDDTQILVLLSDHTYRPLFLTRDWKKSSRWQELLIFGLDDQKTFQTRGSNSAQWRNSFIEWNAIDVEITLETIFSSFFFSFFFLQSSNCWGDISAAPMGDMLAHLPAIHWRFGEK